MDEESKRMKDMESAKSDHEDSQLDKNSTVKENDDGEDDAHTEDQKPAQLEPQEDLNGVDEDLIEIIQSFKKHKDSLSHLLKDGTKLAVEDLIVFKDKADDIIGYELENFINFLSTRYSLAKTKYSLPWEELLSALNQWAIYQSEDRKRERVEDWMDENQDYNDGLEDLPEAGDELDVERYRNREKSKD